MRVAGVSFRQEEVKKVQLDDKVELELEPNNPYDPNAIKVIIGGHWVGYVPRSLTYMFHEARKQGWLVTLKIASMGCPQETDIIGIILNVEFSHGN